MEDLKSDIEILIDSLDKSVNSNTAWLHFSINSTKTFVLKSFLLSQLETGYFHFNLVQSDINRGWEHYVSLTHSNNWQDTILLLQKPGNTWNNNDNISYEEVTIDEAKNFILDLLTGGQKFFSRSSLGTIITKELASTIFDNFVKHLQGHKQREITFYNIKPDFLTTVEDYYKSDYTKLGYFENSGRDFVLGIVLYEREMDTLELNILMTNGYS
jgi:hypothetical protein